MDAHSRFYMEKGFREAEQVRIAQGKAAEQAAIHTRRVVSAMVAKRAAEAAATVPIYRSPEPVQIAYDPPVRVIQEAREPPTVQLNKPRPPMNRAARIYMVITIVFSVAAGSAGAAYFASIYPALTWMTVFGALAAFLTAALMTGVILMQTVVAMPVFLTIRHPYAMAMVWLGLGAGAAYWFGVF